jgi:hypothetical protein
MPPGQQPPQIDPLTELLAREPIFHRPAFASTIQDFDAMMAPDYWEIGASGRRYTRAFILQHLALNPPVDAAIAGWQILDPQCRALAPKVCLFTYTLHQGARRTRRATVWQSTPSGWQVLYHQGTVIPAESDVLAPPENI